MVVLLHFPRISIKIVTKIILITSPIQLNVILRGLDVAKTKTMSSTLNFLVTAFGSTKKFFQLDSKPNNLLPTLNIVSYN